MSVEALRAACVKEFESLRAEALGNACRVRPHSEATADGIALRVIDHLAMARAYELCAKIINDEFQKLTTPHVDEMKKKVRNVY